MTEDRVLTLSGPWEHEHVHRFDEGERRFRHAHSAPDGDDENTAKPHAHKNGRHSHPHMDHGLYGEDPA